MDESTGPVVDGECFCQEAMACKKCANEETLALTVYIYILQSVIPLMDECSEMNEC